MSACMQTPGEIKSLSLSRFLSFTITPQSTVSGCLILKTHWQMSSSTVGFSKALFTHVLAFSTEKKKRFKYFHINLMNGTRFYSRPFNNVILKYFYTITVCRLNEDMILMTFCNINTVETHLSVGKN